MIEFYISVNLKSKCHFLSLDFLFKIILKFQQFFFLFCVKDKNQCFSYIHTENTHNGFCIHEIFSLLQIHIIIASECNFIEILCVTHRLKNTSFLPFFTYPFNKKSIVLSKHNLYTLTFLHKHVFFELAYVLCVSCTLKINLDEITLTEEHSCLLAPHVSGIHRESHS